MYVSKPGHQYQGLYILLVPGPDNADTAARDIPEPNMEPAELASDDKEQPKRLRRILHLGQELWCQTERERDLRRLVEVRLKHMPANAQSAISNGFEGWRNGKRTC